MPKYAEAAQGVIKEINDCRTNPTGYAFKIEHFAEKFKGKVRYREDDVPVLSREGLYAVHECISWLKSVPAVSALTSSVGLSSACQVHCRALGMDGLTTHRGEDEADFQSRISAFGKWRGRVSELLDFGSISAREIVFSLLVDDGLSVRPHRQELMRGDFRCVGVGIGPHEGLKSVCAIVLASKFVSAIGAQKVNPPSGMLIGTWEARGWLEGAVRLNCEITSEEQEDRMIKRVAKLWLMADGSERRTDEVIYDAEEEGSVASQPIR